MSYKNQELIEENISIDTEIQKNLSKSIIISNDPIVLQLIEFGYDEKYSRRVMYYLHPEDIEEALDYMAIRNGIIQHRFVHNNREILSDICYICGEKKEIHLKELSININQEQKNISEINKIKDIYSSDNINNKNDNEHNINNINIKNDDNITPYYVNTDENELNNEEDNKEKKEIIIECPACFERFCVNENNKVKNCGHAFCEQCWYKFLSIKINENKLPSIKCLEYKCNEKLTDKFIFNLLNYDYKLIGKYKQYKLELNILQDPNKKLCPFPNCNSYLELKDIKNKYVSCLNNHKFCFLCLKKPHGNIPCEKTIDSDLKEYAQNNFVKKCPHCGIIIEKQSGCNHITCSKCGYQWCWLCNNKYENDHFDKGKCKGFKFFNPKNEYEIKQVMKGKMNYKKLSKSERQYDNDDKNINIVANKLSNNFVTFSTIEPSSYKNEDNFIHVHSFHMSDKILFIINFIFFRNCINRNLEILNPFIIYGYLLLNITLFFQLFFINMISFLLSTKKQGLNKIMLIEKNKRKLNKKLIIMSFPFIVTCYLPLFIIINFFI